MWSYVTRRLIILVPVVLGVRSSCSRRCTSSLATRWIRCCKTAGERRGAGAPARATGLDDPFLIQYGRFLARLASGDLGTSLVTGRDVTSQIASQLPATVQLTFAALAIAVLVGVPLGVVSAIKRGTWVDSGSMVFALLGVSMPNFWLGLLLILTFSLQLKWFPAAGTGGWRYLVLPAITLGFSGCRHHRAASRLEPARGDPRRLRPHGALEGSAARHRHRQARHGNAMGAVMTIVGLQSGALSALPWPSRPCSDARTSMPSRRRGPTRQLAARAASVMLAALGFVLVNCWWT